MLNIQIDKSDLEACIKQDIEISISEISKGDFATASSVFDCIRADYE